MKQRFLIVFSLLFCVTPVVFSQLTHEITYTADEITLEQYWKSFSPSFNVTVPQLGADGNTDNIGVYVGVYYESPSPRLVMTLINGNNSVNIPEGYGVLIKSTGAGKITLTETISTDFYQGANSLEGSGATEQDPTSLRLSDMYLMVLHKSQQCFVSYIGNEFIPTNKAYFTASYVHPAPSIRIVDESETTTTLDDCEEEAVVTKIVQNGQLLIVRDGITFDLMGRTIR